mmetsp:Transcript_48538/g.122541  ORF Transcript_48538/g.122541 Transcript_48538/m.122541 type:complete len:253 (-) Transcript_48538:987-1745(-)
MAQARDRMLPDGRYSSSAHTISVTWLASPLPTGRLVMLKVVAACLTSGMKLRSVGQSSSRQYPNWYVSRWSVAPSSTLMSSKPEAITVKVVSPWAVPLSGVTSAQLACTQAGLLLTVTVRVAMELACVAVLVMRTLNVMSSPGTSAPALITTESVYTAPSTTSSAATCHSYATCSAGTASSLSTACRRSSVSLPTGRLGKLPEPMTVMEPVGGLPVPSMTSTVILDSARRGPFSATTMKVYVPMSRALAPTV